MKKKSADFQSHINGAARHVFRCRLAARWIEIHRPDVWKVIGEEADKRYPRSRGEKAKKPLPKRLEAMK